MSQWQASSQDINKRKLLDFCVSLKTARLGSCTHFITSHNYSWSLNKFAFYLLLFMHFFKCLFLFSKVQQQLKLPSLYLLDSIVKNVGGDYLHLVAQILERTFTCVFEKVHVPFL